MWPGCGSLPSTGSSYAVPGWAMSRSARAWTPGRNSPAPISQSPATASWPSSRCLRQEAKTSETDSLSAPGLALVDQAGGVLGDRVGELVAEHVDRLGEPVEDLAVAVAEDQLLAVPERVVVVRAGSAPSRPRWRRRRRRSRGRRPRRTAPATRPRRRPPRRRRGRRSARRPVSAPARPAARSRCARCAPPRPGPAVTAVTRRALQPDRRRRGRASARSTRRPRAWLSAIWRSRYGGTKQCRGHVRRHPVGREAAGGDRPPALGSDPDQRLALPAHRRAVLVPVGVLAGDAAEVLDQARPPPPGSACRAPRRCRRPAPRRRPTRRRARARWRAGRGAGWWPWRGRGRSRSTIRPSASTPPVTGESWGRPSARVVTRTRWWRVRTKSSSSSRSTRVFVAMRGMAATVAAPGDRRASRKCSPLAPHAAFSRHSTANRKVDPRA